MSVVCLTCGMHEAQKVVKHMQNTSIADFCSAGERKISPRKAHIETIHIVHVVCEMVQILFIDHQKIQPKYKKTLRRERHIGVS